MRRVYGVYLGLGLCLWPVPLLNVLQAEAAAVVALAAFFISGITSIGALQRGASVVTVLGRQEAALLLPLGLLTIAQLWAPNCTFGQGLLFYGLFPGITVIFSVALAYVLDGFDLRRPRTVLAGIGVLLIVAGPVYDLGFHPQFYTYNHVFGGILGPIYDEQLAVRSGLFVFRGLTLLWAGAAFLLGMRLRGRGPRWALPLCALAIGGIYAFAGPLGINTTEGVLQSHLEGHVQTAHFDIYYDSERLDRAEAQDLAKAHEDRYAWLERRLDVRTTQAPSRIQSYIYPNPDVKGRLTGARTTSVSPVWLSQPQVHLLRERVASSLGHELAHVFSRPYGLPGLQSSWAPGLVEGWAVALEPPSAEPSPHDLVVTGMASDTASTLRSAADAVADRLSPWGFWTARGGVSYATMGSFVRYLLDEYGAERLKQVYAQGNFQAVYGHSLEHLAAEWARRLAKRPVVASAAHDVVARVFTRPSLFEVECPHYVPPHRRHLQNAQRAARRRDTVQMKRHLHRALRHEPQYAAAHRSLARLRLAQGKTAAVLQQLDSLSEETRTAGLRVALADAYVLSEAPTQARSLYVEALAHVPSYAPETQVQLLLREAVADRPEAVRILVSGDSAHVQARRLAGLEKRGDAIEAWRGVRLMEARSYDAAFDVWQRQLTPVRNQRPQGWHRVWALQQTAWQAKAAEHTGRWREARQLALEAAQQARRLGDRNRAAVFEWWAERTAPQINAAAAGSREKKIQEEEGEPRGGSSG